MNDLCADIGYKSINHAGEELCGDHVDVVNTADGSTVIVLLRRDAAALLPEIREASARGEEFPVRMGQKIGFSLQ